MDSLYSPRRWRPTIFAASWRLSANDIVTFQVSEDSSSGRTLAREEANVTDGLIAPQVGFQKPVNVYVGAVIHSVRCVLLDPPSQVPEGRDFVKPEPSHD